MGNITPSLGICNTFPRRVPGQKLFNNLRIFQIGIVCGFQQPGQILIWIQPILNGRLNQAEHDRTAGSSLGGVGKQEVLPVNDKGLDTPLRPVIAQLQPAVF